MNFVAGCETCRSLSAEYEAATMQWFRVQGQLRVAEYSREAEASTRIIAELNVISARRNAIRDAVEKHNIEKHPRAATAR
jgi:hypothetical protein